MQRNKEHIIIYQLDRQTDNALLDIPTSIYTINAQVCTYVHTYTTRYWWTYRQADKQNMLIDSRTEYRITSLQTLRRAQDWYRDPSSIRQLYRSWRSTTDSKKGFQSSPAISVKTLASSMFLVFSVTKQIIYIYTFIKIYIFI